MIIYDIQSKVTKIDVFLVTIVIKFRERVRSRGREVHRDRQKTEHGKKCGNCVRATLRNFSAKNVNGFMPINIFRGMMPRLCREE